VSLDRRKNQAWVCSRCGCVVWCRGPCGTLGSLNLSLISLQFVEQ